MATKIYFDNAATTPVRPEVLDTILPYFREYYGNASSIYGIAKESKRALENARGQESRRLMRKKAATSSRQKLNTMPYCIRRNIWRSTEQR